QQVIQGDQFMNEKIFMNRGDIYFCISRCQLIDFFPETMVLLVEFVYFIAIFFGKTTLVFLVQRMDNMVKIIQYPFKILPQFMLIQPVFGFSSQKNSDIGTYGQNTGRIINPDLHFRDIPSLVPGLGQNSMVGMSEVPHGELCILPGQSVRSQIKAGTFQLMVNFAEIVMRTVQKMAEKIFDASFFPIGKEQSDCENT